MKKEKRQVLTTARVREVREATDNKGPSIDIQCIAAGMSLNYNYYSPEVLEAAVPLYEGARSFLDHTWGLSVRNLAGSLDAAGWDSEAEAVTATLYPVIETDAGVLLLGLAKAEKRFRENGILDDGEFLFGFSHVVYGIGDWREGPQGEYWSYTEILEVESVDAVSFPAANGYMKDVSESRQNHLKSLLATEAREQKLPGLERVVKHIVRDVPAVEGHQAPKGGRHAPTPERKLRMKVKPKESKLKVNMDAVRGRIELEGVSRDELDQVLELASSAALEQAETHYEAELAGVRGELEDTKSKLSTAETTIATHQAAEAEQVRKDGIESLFSELAVPEARREGFRTRFNKEGRVLSVEAARDVLEAYMEDNVQEAAGGKGKSGEQDVESREQDNQNAYQEAEEIGIETAKAWGAQVVEAKE